MTVTTLGDFEVHTLPSGVSVAYRDRDHSYWKTTDGKKGSGRLTGISTVVSPYDWRPDNLMRWAARINCEGVAVLAAEALSYDDADEMRAMLGFLVTGDAIAQALDNARLSYTHTRDDAADRGTNVHKHGLQALAEGHMVPHIDRLTPLEQGYNKGIMEFWLQHEPRPIVSEAVVCDPDLGVAGRLDLIAETREGIVLFDAKTSGFIPTKHHVQLAGYRHCALTCGLVDRIDKAYVLQVTADGDFDLIESQGSERSFGLAVELYRDAARVQRESNQARKAAAAATEAVAA